MESDLSRAQSLRDALLSNDLPSAGRISGLAGDEIPVRVVLRGLSLAAARHDEPRAPALRAMLFVDAVRDLVPTYAGESARPLIEGALRALAALDYGECRPEALLLPERESLEVVAVAELEEPLHAGRLDDALRACARLLSVIRTKEYFLENLLELAVRACDPWTLASTVAAVKSLNDLSGEPLREIVYGLIRYLSRRGGGRAPRPPGGSSRAPERRDWITLFRAALATPAALEETALYLAAAFQAQRYAEVRRGRILSQLSSCFDERLPGWESEPTGEAPPSPEPTGESLTSIDPSEGARLRDLLAEGDAKGAGEVVRRWWGRVEDPDPIYRWIAEACLGKGRPDAAIDSLVSVNASRWGAHLMEPDGLPMADAAISHLCASAQDGMEDG
jgi:hypothetical protein